MDVFMLIFECGSWFLYAVTLNFRKHTLAFAHGDLPRAHRAIFGFNFCGKKQTIRHPILFGKRPIFNFTDGQWGGEGGGSERERSVHAFNLPTFHFIDRAAWQNALIYLTISNLTHIRLWLTAVDSLEKWI